MWQAPRLAWFQSGFEPRSFRKARVLAFNQVCAGIWNAHPHGICPLVTGQMLYQEVLKNHATPIRKLDLIFTVFGRCGCPGKAWKLASSWWWIDFWKIQNRRCFLNLFGSQCPVHVSVIHFKQHNSGVEDRLGSAMDNEKRLLLRGKPAYRKQIDEAHRMLPLVFGSNLDRQPTERCKSEENDYAGAVCEDAILES